MDAFIEALVAIIQVAIEAFTAIIEALKLLL